MSLKDTITNILNAASEDALNDFFQENCDSTYCDKSTKEVIAKFNSAGIKFVIADSYGGEGMGEEYWVTYIFENEQEKVFVKFDGWYQSYNGSEYTEWFFVNPVQVMVTQYQRVE